MEIHDVDALDERLTAGAPLAGLRLQDLDLAAAEPALSARTDLEGLVVLGGRLSPALRTHLIAHGAVVFPAVTGVPVEVYRASLYTADELYAGLDAGYAATADARAYAWSRDALLTHDAYATLLRAVHDDSVTDALDEWIARRAGRRGDGWARGRSRQPGLRRGGAVGAWPRRSRLRRRHGWWARRDGGREPGRHRALRRRSRRRRRPPGRGGVVPAGRRRVGAARLPVRAGFPPVERPRSLGIPTWFYGHEPPNVFADGIAKYFSNALREDGLLARSTAGVVVAPGAAGTVQEIFQFATRLFYAAPDTPAPPLVLLGREHWTCTLPVVALLEALGRGRAMATAVHVVDTVAEAVAALSR